MIHATQFDFPDWGHVGLDLIVWIICTQLSQVSKHTSSKAVTTRTCSLQESGLPGRPLWPNLSAGRTLGLVWLSRSAVPNLYIPRTVICICRLWSANKPISQHRSESSVDTSQWFFFSYMLCFKDWLQQSFVIVDNMISISHLYVLAVQWPGAHIVICLIHSPPAVFWECPSNIVSSSVWNCVEWLFSAFSQFWY